MSQQPASEPGRSSPDFLAVPPEPRRGFVKQALAVLTGAIVTLVPAAAGLAVFLDPLRKRQKRGSKGQDDEGFIRVATLDGLLIGGAPRKFSVIDDRSDAWNLFPQESIGLIFLLRTGEKDVRAYNASCPHAGCFVDFDGDRKLYQCPCHDSSFKVTGEIASEKSPAARGLDELEVRIKNDAEVWVKFQNFIAGTAQKTAEA
ncbi:MAG: ubiquinol-cytochrome c reductase iron-sulfur subunit [Deltaproteobacteria bacterium]